MQWSGGGAGRGLEGNVAAVGDEFEVTSVLGCRLADGELFGNGIRHVGSDFCEEVGEAVNNGGAAEEDAFAFGSDTDDTGVRFSVLADEFDGFVGGEDVGVAYFRDFVKPVVEVILCHSILLVVWVLKVILLYQFQVVSWSFCDDIRSRFQG